MAILTVPLSPPPVLAPAGGAALPPADGAPLEPPLPLHAARTRLTTAIPANDRASLLRCICSPPHGSPGRGPCLTSLGWRPPGANAIPRGRPPSMVGHPLPG